MFIKIQFLTSFLCVIVITGCKELITFSSECISLASWYLNHKKSQKHCLSNIRVRSKFSHLEYSVLLLEMRSYTYHFWNICGKFKHRRRRESFRFQWRAEIKPRSILLVKKFGQPWLLLTVQYLECILTIAIFECVSGQRTSCLSHSFFFFFHCSSMKIRPGQAEKNEKASSLYRLRQSKIAEKMKRCVP